MVPPRLFGNYFNQYRLNLLFSCECISKNNHEGKLTQTRVTK